MEAINNEIIDISPTVTRDISLTQFDNSLVINTPTPTALQFPLHAAARKGDTSELKNLLIGNAFSIHVQDTLGRTPLHYAAKSGVLECVRLILNCSQLKSANDEGKVGFKFKKFLDIQDKSKETALHLAVKNGNTEIVAELLLAGANADLQSLVGETAMGLIYYQMHEVMKTLFDKAVRWNRNTTTEGKNMFEINLNAMVGNFSDTEDVDVNEGNKQNSHQFNIETDRLETILESRNKECQQLLVHPVVRLYPHLKWLKIRILFWISIFIQVTWLIFYTLFTWDMYLNKCPNLLHESGASSTQYLPRECTFTSLNTWMCSIVSVISVVIAFKEVFQMISTFPRYFLNIENIGQWLIIFLTFITTSPVYVKQSTISAWQYQVAAFAIVLAWILILNQLGKLPRLGIYVEVLEKVLKRFAYFSLTFISLLIAFALSLSILLPEKQSFHTLPLAILKVIVMMTGELNYDDVFHQDENTPPFPVSTQIIFMGFTLIVAVILFNLLLGFTINDIQQLEVMAKETRLAVLLEQIYIMESFIVSASVQNILARINKLQCLGRYFLTTESNSEMNIQVPLSDVPNNLRDHLRKLADDNENGISEDAALYENVEDPSLCETQKMNQDYDDSSEMSNESEGTIKYPIRKGTHEICKDLYGICRQLLVMQEESIDSIRTQTMTLDKNDKMLINSIGNIKKTLADIQDQLLKRKGN